MARKTYSIILIIIALIVLLLIGLQIERRYNQRKINQTEKLFRQKFSLGGQEKVAVCNYQKDWQVVSALERVWLVNNNQIYKTDLDNYKDNEFRDIAKQPANSPMIDYYHLSQQCLW